MGSKFSKILGFHPQKIFGDPPLPPALIYATFGQTKVGFCFENLCMTLQVGGGGVDAN
jgi:hypothetical protein